jgi:ribosome-associated protein
MEKMSEGGLGGRDLSGELIYTSSRSSGPGGQNVNKVSTRIELRFNLAGSTLLNEEEKRKIQSSLGNRINKEGFLILVSQSERSQLANKKKGTERFYKLLQKALLPVKKRKPTHPTLASKERRIESKKMQSRKKALRKMEES